MINIFVYLKYITIMIKQISFFVKFVVYIFKNHNGVYLFYAQETILPITIFSNIIIMHSDLKNMQKSRYFSILFRTQNSRKVNNYET